MHFGVDREPLFEPVLRQTHTKDEIGLEAGCSGSEDFELLGGLWRRIEGAPRLATDCIFVDD
jgi:hypothetical protein